MKAIALKLHFIVLITLLTQTLNAQCSGCNLTITVPDNNTYNLSAGQTVCIVGTGNFTGRLNNFNGNTLCIGTGVNYNPSTAPNYNGNWTIINHGTFTKTTNLNFNSGTSFTNAATGTISLGSINIGSSTIFNNSAGGDKFFFKSTLAIDLKLRFSELIGQIGQLLFR